MLNFNPILQAEINACGTLKSVKEGQIIFSGNMNAASLPIVLNGNIRITRQDNDGREILLYYLKTGESCIASLFKSLNSQPMKMKAVAVEDSEILFIPLAKANEWLKLYPQWTDFIFTLYQKRFDELLETVNAIAFQKLDERIYDLLKKKAEIKGSNELAVTHQQLAADLGTTREVISRLLKQMETRQIIQLNRNKITLLSAV